MRKKLDSKLVGLLQLCESTAGDSEASLRLQLALKAATHKAVNRAAPLLIREQQRQMPSLQQPYTDSLTQSRPKFSNAAKAVSHRSERGDLLLSWTWSRYSTELKEKSLYPVVVPIARELQRQNRDEI